MKTTNITTSKVLSDEARPKALPYYLGHIMLYLGLLIVILVIGWLIVKVNRIYTGYQATTRQVAALEASLSTGLPNPDNISKIEDSLRATALSLDDLYEEAEPLLPLAALLGWIPVYGGDIQAVPHLLAASRDLSHGGLLVVEALAPALGADGSPLPYVVGGLDVVKEDLAVTTGQLLHHQAAIKALDVERLSPRLARRVDQFNKYLSPAITGLQLAQVLPFLLGSEAPRTYLILAQNSDELRPAGGYINSAGHIVFDQGNIAEFAMQDSYAVDQLSEAYPYPPDPLHQYMGAEYWVLRDAGWSPDFPTSARTAMNLYKLGRGISVDGVIAVDQHALPYLLRAFQSVDVGDTVVTSENVIKLMRQNWSTAPGQEIDLDWWLQRKSFMVDLAQTIRQKFEQDPNAADPSVLVSALQQASAEKHLLIYLAHPVLSDILDRNNWSGALYPADADYLMTVGANLGFNKANAAVQQALTYKVALDRDGGALVHLNLLYQHDARLYRDDCSIDDGYEPLYEQNIARCLWNYQQIIVPAGARLISGPAEIVEGQYTLRGLPTSGTVDTLPVDSDKISWGQLFLLRPEESLGLDYSYELPQGTAYAVDDYWEYKLYLQKQPGTLNTPIQMTLTLPEGARLLESSPEPSSQQGTIVNYAVNLNTDREIKVSYSLP